MPSSHRRHGLDKTVLSCLVYVGGVNRTGEKSRLSATENFKTVFQSQNAVRTTEDSLDLSRILFTPPNKTRQESFVMSVV